MSGYIKLHRGWRENAVFKGEYSRADAWVWLLEHACWKPTRVRIKGTFVTLERGEMTFSIRYLADAWGWSKSRVDRFFDDLRSEGMIETRSKIGTTAGQQAGQGQAIIKVCNYGKYQDSEDTERDNDVSKSGTSAGQQRDKEEEVKEIKEKKKPIAIDVPGWVPADAWEAFVDMRRSIKKPLTDRAKALSIKKLDELRRAGSDPRKVLEQSVMNSWQGLFEAKPEKREVQVGI